MSLVENIQIAALQEIFLSGEWISSTVGSLPERQILSATLKKKGVTNKSRWVSSLQG